MGDDLSYGLNTLGLLCLWQCLVFSLTQHPAFSVAKRIAPSILGCTETTFVDFHLHVDSSNLFVRFSFNHFLADCQSEHLVPV